LKPPRTTGQRSHADFDALPDEERVEILKKLFDKSVAEMTARLKAEADADRAARLATEAATAARHRSEPAPAASQLEIIVAKPEPRPDPLAALAYYDHQLKVLEQQAE
jgi:hypothetical protein